MEYRERSEPLGLSDLLLVYHDFLLALSRRTERLIQDFNAFIQCFNGRWMAAGFHNETGSLNPFGYEKSRWLGGSEFIDVIHACCRAACSPCGFMLHPLAWRVISNGTLRCAKYECVFSLFELNPITLKECLHPFMCRIARHPAPLFKFWLHVSPKLAHCIIVVCHKILCRYPLMREKCFGGELPALRLPLCGSIRPPSRHPKTHPKTFLILVSANSLPVLPVLTPFSLSRGDTLSPTGSHPVIQHVYV